MASRFQRREVPEDPARAYRDALTRAAVAAREAALLQQILAAQDVVAIKGEEPTEVDDLLLAAGRASLAAREAAIHSRAADIDG